MRYLVCLLALAACSEEPDYTIRSIEIWTQDGEPSKVELLGHLGAFCVGVAEEYSVPPRVVWYALDDIRRIHFWSDSLSNGMYGYVTPRHGDISIQLYWPGEEIQVSVLYHELMHVWLWVHTGTWFPTDDRADTVLVRLWEEYQDGL